MKEPVPASPAVTPDRGGIDMDGTVFTLDADFRMYRRHGNKENPVLMPWS